jgi:GAF domain-containing protein
VTDRSISVALGPETLYAVIGAVAEGPDLDRVLPAVVDLLVDATACHACFIYLREDEALVLRAASPVFAHVVGTVRMRLDEGLTGWVARHRTPAFIRDAALEDPRMKYFAELDEDRFQSMVAVPLMGQGADVIGVVVLHTEAPREFDQAVLDFLVHVASLVAGAIDNARLYEQSRRQVQALSALAEFSEDLASLNAREALYEAGCGGIRRLLRADACRLILQDERGSLIEVASSGADEPGGAEPLVHAPADGRLVARLLDGEVAFGTISTRRAAAPFRHEEVQLLESCAHQFATALRKAELIERLASGNLVRDLFAALERGDAPAAAAHARAAGWSPGHHHAVVVALPAVSDTGRWEVELADRVEARLRFVAPNLLADSSGARLRALAPLRLRRQGDGVDRLASHLNQIGRELGVTFGISRARAGFANGAVGIREASDAAIVARALDEGGSARTYADLGPYQYLAALAEGGSPASPHARAIEALEAYDRRRNTDLVVTLEQYLADRGIAASARSLTIHPNTLRQRLSRIEELTQLSLEREDLLSLELALKVARLRGLSRGRDP